MPLVESNVEPSSLNGAAGVLEQSMPAAAGLSSEPPADDVLVESTSGEPVAVLVERRDSISIGRLTDGLAAESSRLAQTGLGPQLPRDLGHIGRRRRTPEPLQPIDHIDEEALESAWRVRRQPPHSTFVLPYGD